ncbi:hypothetical protein GOM49_02050 [Clostridium bovifaecis]|uniref:Uncharacterized protein n=1 Tax=Clostridium bovifaecis TaxID=2184719 RepID=A0A6I6EVA1_9CLOT|nr:hypothetical protein GOM49_02050 [Clostridium bovifaecis]
MDEIIYDVLKLNLLDRVTSEASELLAKLIENKNIKIEELYLDYITDQLNITIKCENLNDAKFLYNTAEAINNTLCNSLSEYVYK